MPTSSDCALKYATVSLLMLIVICFLSRLEYGFFIASEKSYSSFMVSLLKTLPILTFLSSGCLSCRYETQHASRTAAMTNNQHAICFAHSKHNEPLFIQRVRFVVFEKSIIIMDTVAASSKEMPCFF